MAEQSSIGNHLAELWNSIQHHTKAVEEAEEAVKTAKSNLQSEKAKFAKYLTDQQIDKLIFPSDTQIKFEQKGNKEDKNTSESSRKPRTSPKVLEAQTNRNRLAFKEENYQPLGLNKIGEPAKYKGNGSKNAEIKNQMEQDIRDYEDQYGSFTTPITLESLKGEHKFLLEPQVETISKGEGDEAAAAEAIEATAPKASTKKKAVAA